MESKPVVEQGKNAVIVGRIELKPRQEVVVKAKGGKPQRSKQVEARPPKKKDPPKKYDARTENQQVFQELQYVKKQLAAAKSNATEASSLRLALTELVSALSLVNDAERSAATAEAVTEAKKVLGIAQ